jgi:glycine dehydrogenase subunit 1
VPAIDNLYCCIPESARFPTLDLPEGASEPEALEELNYLAEANTHAGVSSCFLGAGAYHHFIPSAVSYILSRGEFSTAYTPYQPEISQGTLQAIFEYQSLIAALTGMEVSNASHYDGATAAAEAVILALNQVRGRKRIVLSPALHPQYREVIRTYTQGLEVRLAGDEVPETLSLLQARSRAKHLATCVDESTALVITQYPNFFGEM